MNDAAMNIVPIPEGATDGDILAAAGIELPRGREVLLLPLDLVVVEDRLRPVDAERVAEIAKSIEQAGQITPIEVMARGDGTYQLVAGAHREAAMRLLGRRDVEATIFEGEEDEARLREIDENLYRHELNALDQAVFMAERQAIYLRLYPETKKGGDRRSDQSAKFALSSRAPSFAADVSKRIGLSKRTIQLALQRHAELSAEAIGLLRGTKLARKGSTLDALADVPREQQAKVVKALLRDAPDAPRTVREARQAVLREAPPTPKPGKAPLDRAKSAIEALSVEERVQLVAWMGNRGYVAHSGKARAA